MRDDSRWSVVSFFDDEEAAGAAEARFEELGDEIPEHVRGKRVSPSTATRSPLTSRSSARRGRISASRSEAS